MLRVLREFWRYPFLRDDFFCNFLFFPVGSLMMMNL